MQQSLVSFWHPDDSNMTLKAQKFTKFPHKKHFIVTTVVVSETGLKPEKIGSQLVCGKTSFHIVLQDFLCLWHVPGWSMDHKNDDPKRQWRVHWNRLRRSWRTCRVPQFRVNMRKAFPWSYFAFTFPENQKTRSKTFDPDLLDEPLPGQWSFQRQQIKHPSSWKKKWLFIQFRTPHGHTCNLFGCWDGVISLDMHLTKQQDCEVKNMPEM